ncbi:hypothetical protein COV93_07555, partial [Candidatus Woesearchaeota archaeon CG11_big_fil_rev_8_21_14_0_20_43_8]
EIEDKKLSRNSNAGTEVKISQIEKSFPSLRPEEAVQEITMGFALYMRQYPKVSLWYDGNKIDPSGMEMHSEDYKLPSITMPGEKNIEATLTVIE